MGPAQKLPNPLFLIASQPCPQWYAQPKSYQIHCFPLLPSPAPSGMPSLKVTKSIASHCFPLLPIASQPCPQWYAQPKSYQIHCFPLLPIASQPCPQWYAQRKSYQIHCFPLLPIASHCFPALPPVVCPAQKLPNPLLPTPM